MYFDKRDARALYRIARGRRRDDDYIDFSLE